MVGKSYLCLESLAATAEKALHCLERTFVVIQ